MRMLLVDEYNYAAKASSLLLLKNWSITKRLRDLPRGFRQTIFRVIENEDDN